jgi:ubiquinol-cytochrome c reductase cytochrome b subunit
MTFIQQLILFFNDCKWGGWALICLYISLFSGIIVGIQYQPATPYYSSVSIELIVPFGAYFRSLHYYSSQLFFLLSCCHFIATYSKTDKFTKKDWLFLTSSLPVGLLLLFTGYILRDDITGASAGFIAENIIQSIPLVGHTLNDLLFSISEHGMRKVYLHHIISFDLLLLVLLWAHLRKYKTSISQHPLLLISVFILPIYLTAPLDPELPGIEYITGPWFFLGLQELLRYFPPFLAGVAIPALLLVFLFSIFKGNRYQRESLYLLLPGLFLYAILSVIAFNR